ncbi:hypothetical protein GO986_09005 [Deinococcus sp. HMF7620]|uniref:Uncharacterized protein n=1 Tax=Deinococcus arboris TaxID=2682977 RepID=A0A7C9M1R2_9DEIO|nr:hypothetical protein [Deinococcus arboris]MVN86902.1 hypothetical protein [Deinococcus arboris]
MTQDKSYVALKPLRFGDQALLPGDPVPVEPGRDYGLMVRLKQIAEVPAGAAAVPQQTTPPAAPFPEGARLVFVAEDGAHSLATFLGVLRAQAHAAEALDVEEGALIASVTFEDDPVPVVVRLDSLLPEQPTARLVAGLLTVAAQHNATQVQLSAQLQGQVDFLELLIQAIRAPGDPLPADFPAAEFLAENGVTTLPGLQLLAQGEEGSANLQRLNGIGKGRARDILAALTPPAPDTPAPPEA